MGQVAKPASRCGRFGNLPHVETVLEANGDVIPLAGGDSMAGKRFLMNVGRTTKQGQQINIGKDSAEYQAIVNTVIMNAVDMKETGIAAGETVRVRSDNGQALFQCKEGKVPQGMIFVPYGPPTCRLMGQTTDGTGMPTSKGWEVEVEPVPKDGSSVA